MLVSGLHMASLSLNEQELKVNDDLKVPSKTERDEKIQQIRTGFINRLHLNRPWAYGLGFCEVLNFTNVIMQIYLTDWFLAGAFLGLGQAVTEPLPKDRTDPLDIVFPKVSLDHNDHPDLACCAGDNFNAHQRASVSFEVDAKGLSIGRRANYELGLCLI